MRNCGGKEVAALLQHSTLPCFALACYVSTAGCPPTVLAIDSDIITEVVR